MMELARVVLLQNKRRCPHQSKFADLFLQEIGPTQLDSLQRQE
jgi:hypothetical protein